MKKEAIINLIGYAFIALFIYTALSKWMLYHVYLDDLRRSPELGAFALPISIIVPGVEIITALMLLFSRTKPMGFILALILMIIFTIYVSYVLIFADDLPCTCGGIIRELTWPQHLIFNILFTILAGLGVYFTRGRHKAKYTNNRILAS